MGLGQYGENCGRAGHRLRRVGSWRHESLARLHGEPRSALPSRHGRGTRPRNGLKANHVGFLDTVRMNDIDRLFQEGTNVTHGSSEALTKKGRKLTNRQMPY